MTCWRRLRDWQAAGVWDALHRRMLDRLNLAGQIDWSRACVDASSVPAKGGPTRSAPTRRTAASQARNATSWSTARACPFAVVPSGANVHDSCGLIAVVDALAPVRQRRGRPRKRPVKLHADKAYNFRRCRQDLRRRGTTPRIARRGQLPDPRSPSLGRGKHLRLDQPVLSPACPLRAARLPLPSLLVFAYTIICWRSIQRFC